jgi:hypothetical protein
MKRILFLLALWPLSAHAIINGCFLETRGNTGYCSNAKITVEDCRIVDGWGGDSLLTQFGYTATFLCLDLMSSTNLFETCKTSLFDAAKKYADSEIQYRECAANYNALAQSNKTTALAMQSSQATVKKLNTLVSKLRKACGTRCRSIK